jgi:hypothetical protein
MVNTLRIASVLAVIVAGVFLASVTGFISWRSLDAGKDEELSRILSAPSVVDKFRESQGDKTQDRQDAISPLVKEAEAFALFLNPPAPAPTAPTPKPTIPRIPPRPGSQVSTSAKFDLLGTSYSAASQSECFAYIKMQDGRTYRWVRTGDVIGHMQVKEIRKDSIVCSDGNIDTPMFVPQRQNPSSLLEAVTSPVAAVDSATPPSVADRITGLAAAESAASSVPVASQVKAPLLSPTTDAERAALSRLVDQLKASAGQSEEKRAAVSKIMDEFREARERAEAAGQGEHSANEPNVSPNVSPLGDRPGIRRRLGTVR